MADREDSHFQRGQQAYIFDDEYLPVYVGEGKGNLDYEDAIDISILERMNLDLPASRDYITAVVGHPRETRKEWKSPQTPRASKNNPYQCVYCPYKSTRHANMVAHLRRFHNDYQTDPRDGR